MDLELRAKELALSVAILAFFGVALLGIVAGAESYVASLRGLAAGAAVAFAGRFPARVLLEALEPPVPESEAEPGAQEATAREAAPRRNAKAA